MIKEEKMNEFTPKQQIILNNLSYGKENAISKRELMKLTGLDERSVRSNIAILRKSKNILICSNSQSKGYYFPKMHKRHLNLLTKQIEELLNWPK